MKKIFFLVILLCAVISCSLPQRLINVALLVSQIKEEVEQPAVKKETVLTEKPAKKMKEKEVIPPEKEIRLPGSKQVTVRPGVPSGKVEDLSRVESIGQVIGKPDEEQIYIIKSEEEVKPEEELEMPSEEMISLIFGKPIKEKIVMFPFENMSEASGVQERIMPVLSSALRKISIGTVDNKLLYGFLCSNRIRATGHITKDLALQTYEEFDVKSILLGSVVSYVNRGDPHLGLLARLIDSKSGRIIWASYASAAGADFTGILGLRSIRNMNALIPRIVDNMLVSFNTTIPYKEIESTYKIAIMPFRNKTKFKDAGVMVSYMFLVELFKSLKFEILEYGEIKKAIIERKIRNKGELDYETVSLLSETLGVDGIVLGVVEQYDDGLATSSPPSVTISARLLNGRKNKIVWYNSLQLNGNEDISILDFGKIRSVDRVAYKIVSRLAVDMETAEWR
ncbi:MAG: CsgG/HfaB family protein [Nitrospirota bacterium]